MLVRESNNTMIWAQFKEAFYDKYFPQCVRNRKVSEFGDYSKVEDRRHTNFEQQHTDKVEDKNQHHGNEEDHG
ncbi:unnamed protein product [Camellia sinensis]